MYRIRPAKGLSFIIMAVGGLMTLFGLFSVISWAGFFGVIWMLLALGLTIYHGINVFSKNGVAFGIIERKNRRKLK